MSRTSSAWSRTTCCDRSSRPHLPLRALRHRGSRERARSWSGASRREPPQLFRRRGARSRRTRHRATRALPRQEGDLRRARGRADRPLHRRYRGRPGEWLQPATALGRVRPQGRRGRDRAAAGDDPPRVRLLRPSSPRQDRYRTPRGLDRGNRRTRRALGHGEGVAAFLAPARRRARLQAAHRHRAGGQAGRALAERRQGRHQDASWRPSPRCCPRNCGFATSPRPRSWRVRSPLGEDATRQRHHPRRQRRFATARPRAGHGRRGEGRPPGGPAPPRAPERRPAGVARHRHQREDDHDTSARRGAGCGRGRRGEQRDRVEHAPRPRRGAGRDPRRAGRARGGRDLPPPRPHRDIAGGRGAAEPLAGPTRPDERGPNGGRPLACGARRVAAHAGGGERRRPAGRLGSGGSSPRPLGRCRLALATRCSWLPFVRRADRVRAGRLGVHG